MGTGKPEMSVATDNGSYASFQFMTAFSIRRELPDDWEDIRSVNRLAFGGDAEARLVDRLRTDQALLLSLVAVEAADVIGHVAFSRLPIKTDSAIVRGAALAPMAVIPSRQRQGIGSALIREGLRACREEEIEVVVVLGHLNYYPRFGFTVETAKLLDCPYSGPHLMALELKPGSLRGISTTAEYPAAFSEVD